MKTINEVIIAEAAKWVGTKELINNKEFSTKGFYEFLSSSDWDEDLAYCMYFAEAVWRKAYITAGYSAIAKELEPILTPSAVKSLANAKTMWTGGVSGTPQIGSIAIWQRYKDGKRTWMGHAGIVERINFANNMLFTIEGNTNKPGDREGDGVYRKNRHLLMTEKDNGLVLQSFIIPKQVKLI
jgi:hypothetical protein